MANYLYLQANTKLFWLASHLQKAALYASLYIIHQEQRERSMDFGFEWDQNKARENAHKHDVTFEEAVSVFVDPFLLTFPDDEHSESRGAIFEYWSF